MQTEKHKETYASAGVQIKKAEAFVERIKASARRNGHVQMWKGAGSYAAIHAITAETAVAVTTDGVGTKLLVAHALQKFDTLGVDLVAMCANDLICVGARPNLFLDYFAVGRLDDQIADDVIKGIVDGCDHAGMLLAGGETAEMPGVYAPEHFDLAGFAVGSVTKAQLITGEQIRPGDKVIAVSSTGIHSNGLSLARRVLPESEWSEILTPTAIYVRPVIELLDRFTSRVKGLAHITGGGWRNALRLNDKVGYSITTPPPVPSVFEKIGRTVEKEEMYKTFNMGMGLAIVVDRVDGEMLEIFQKAGYGALLAGEVTDREGVVEISGCDFVLKDKLKD
jgi:phosphoribosylformylglycinamidine cyclo-ligase